MPAAERTPFPPANGAPPRRILAIRTDARLGNLLLLTPSLRLLKTAFPQAEISIFCPARYRDILRFNPHVGRCLGPWSLPLLRMHGYDLAIDFSPYHAFSHSGAFWTRWSGTPRRIGFDVGRASDFLTTLVPPPGSRDHETSNLALLVREAAGWAALPPASELVPEYHFGPGELEEGARMWRAAGLDEESLVLFLGGRAEKRLPPEWHLEIAARARSAGRRIALLMGPAERELLEGRPLPQGVSVLAGFPVRTLAAMLRNARALLTTDSGPMHLAVAIGVPTAAMFSHTEPWRFGYGRRPGHAVLETPGRHATVDEAWEALSGMLAGPRS